MSWYTWAFDGLGTTALISGGAALYRKYVSKRPPILSAPSIPTSEHSTTAAPLPERTSKEPTPEQIISEIDSALPFDREHARDKYKGLNVLWKVNFVSVRSEPDWHKDSDGAGVQSQRWCFTCLFERKEPFIAVSFDLKTVPPELKLLRHGSILQVQGTIRHIYEWGGINLEVDPAKIEILRR
jgi:hypothetical protein